MRRVLASSPVAYAEGRGQGWPKPFRFPLDFKIRKLKDLAPKSLGRGLFGFVELLHFGFLKRDGDHVASAFGLTEEEESTIHR